MKEWLNMKSLEREAYKAYIKKMSSKFDTICKWGQLTMLEQEAWHDVVIAIVKAMGD